MFEQLSETYHHYNGVTFPRFANNTLHVCDWLELMQALSDGSVDMILTDMPYAVTACAWDTMIDLATWWVEVKRVMKPRGAVVCTASQPFTSRLVSSNYEWFHQELIWQKQQPKGFLDAGRKHLLAHESIIIFADGLPHYYPQGLKPVLVKSGRQNKIFKAGAYSNVGNPDYMQTIGNYPRSVLAFEVVHNGTNNHPTQKPVALFEYLIRTYTQPGELVVDPFVGSGTTAVAAKITGRRFICGDQSAEYIDIARKRVFPTFGQPPKRKREEKPITDLPLFAALA